MCHLRCQLTSQLSITSQESVGSMEKIISYFKSLSVAFCLIFLGSGIGILGGMSFFYKGKTEVDLWFAVIIGISVIALVLSLIVSIARCLLTNKKIFDAVAFFLPLISVFLLCWVAFDPSPTAIFNRHVTTNQNLVSLSSIQSSIDYEDNGNHVIRCKFNIDDKDLKKLLDDEKYSPNKNNYILEFPSIRKLDWWNSNFENLPMYMGASIKEYLKVAHINYLWYDKQNRVGYFLQFRLPSEEDKNRTNNLKIKKI